jgi:molybdate transport system ATP-binding protein
VITLHVNKKLHGAEGFMNLDVRVSFEEGEFIALSGKSGSGKTTLLRILAGLEKSNGTIAVDDEVWQNDKIFLPPQKRKIGFVFQDYALFDNMSVEKNLLFVNQDAALANHLLEITELEYFKKRDVTTLSGGQKQRVSLCRAMMNRPKILLMDEPLSALDPNIRVKLQDEILSLHKEFQTTTILVSHDPSEIYKLSSRVVVMEKGQIIKDGTPTDVLLKTNGSQKFSFEGELLDIKKSDVIYIAIVAIGQQLVEIVIDKEEAEGFQIGQKVRVGTKAFNPDIDALSQ